jgi:hypothetical protein
MELGKMKNPNTWKRNRGMGAGKFNSQCGDGNTRLLPCVFLRNVWKKIGVSRGRKNITETANVGVRGRRKIEQSKLMLVELNCKEIRWRIGTKF